MENCCGGRKKHRAPEEKRALQNRLRRIEGQVRGLGRMLEDDAYCPDIMVQVAAANAALTAFGRELMNNHIKTCVAEDVRAGKDETLDELLSVLKKFIK